MVQADDHVLGPFRLILFVLLMLFALLYGLDLRQWIVRDLHAGGFQQSFFTDEQAGVAVAHQFPIDHEQHLVGPIGDMLRVLFRHDHRHGTGLPDAFKHIEDFLLAFRIERRSRFVKDEHVGFRRQCRRDGHTLHLPARQAGRHALAVAGHADQIEHDVDLLVDDVRCDAAVFQRKGDLILNARAEQLRFGILLHVADTFGQRRYGMTAGVHAVDFHQSGHGAVRQIRDDSGQSHAQGGFAGAGRSNDAHERA